MNLSKRNLILASAILNIIDAVGMGIMCLMFGLGFGEYIINLLMEYTLPANFEISIFIIIFALYACMYIASSILLLFSIRKKGEYFAKSKPLYVTGIILTAICSPFSLSAILLYISLGFKDDETNVILDDNFERNQGNNVNSWTEGNGNGGILDDTNSFEGNRELNRQDTEILRVKIEELKKLKESGSISEEEYKEMLTKLLLS